MATRFDRFLDHFFGMIRLRHKYYSSFLGKKTTRSQLPFFLFFQPLNEFTC